MKAYNIIDHEYDVVVLGAGGSGVRSTSLMSLLNHVFILTLAVPLA